MSDYKCYDCEKQFSTEKTIISHMKSEHFYKDNAQKIKCLTNRTESNACRKLFLTFASLRKHMKICIAEKLNDVPRDLNDAERFNCEIDDISKSFVDLNINKPAQVRSTHSFLFICRAMSHFVCKTCMNRFFSELY